MEPKTKAKELLEKMQVVRYVKLGGKNSKSKGLPVSMYKSQVKECALICIDEIINACEYNFVESYNTDWWNKVKKELEKL